MQTNLTSRDTAMFSEISRNSLARAVSNLSLA
jgi:hypothetical protein